MRVVLDEDLPLELVETFASQGLNVVHVEQLGLKGTKNGALLAALADHCNVFVTGDSNLEFQQNIAKLPYAVVVMRPKLLLFEQIVAMVPLVVQAIQVARVGAVTTVRP